jgi:hypothetical protein
MNKIRSSFIVTATFFIAVFFCIPQAFSEKNAPGTLTVGSSLDDQTDISVTIYNSNIGLVRDRRSISLKSGIQELRFMDVASRIIPSSVHIKSVVKPESLRVLEQNYEYDLLNPQKLLDKYVGKNVRLYHKNPYTEREEITDAVLLSNNGGPVFQIGEEITFGHPGRIIFPEVPENLISKPTLLWLVNNSLNTPQDIEASYLTDDITWRADYVLTLNKDDTAASLSGWVTIDNKSGAVYHNAGIKLIAGDINRVREDRYMEEQYARKQYSMSPAEPQFKEEAFFEYHIYTLNRPSTIKDNQTKQISFVKADNVSVKKEFVFQGARRYYYSREDASTKQKVGVFVEFYNKKENDLGIPIPKGIVRVYKYDNQNSLQFIGEDSVDHTPNDEKIRIKIGEAFDVTGARKQTDWKKLASDTYEASFEILLKNHKKEDINVKIIEPVPGEWTILDSTHAFKKTDSSTAEFNVPVLRDSEAKISYRVRMRW